MTRHVPPPRPVHFINVPSHSGAFLVFQAYFEGGASKHDVFGGWDRYADEPYDPPIDVLVVDPCRVRGEGRAEGVRLRRSDLLRLSAEIDALLEAFDAEEQEIQAHVEGRLMAEAS